MVAAATCDAFLTQLAYMMATEAPVTLTKVGTTFVMRGKRSTATFPEEMFPGLPAYKQFRKPK
jgi:hypothetical protein